MANEFLTEDANVETLKAEITDAISWFPLTLDQEWGLGVEIDESILASFDPSDIEFVRADLAPGGYFMTVWASGIARFDLGIHKGEAADIPDESPVTVYDWDWNESMVSAEAEIPARLLVEVRNRDGDLMVSLEDIQPS
ncbi:MAG TPA: hypothetical protein VK501_12960 [Baekduia sp.]|uniref:hypothetical protein n=1 Tax=Baekduia sp. TaxID=2600305 RepID=UPI002BD4FC99|nr:hypothetical protein [Baekduia sp.]HMJ34816.1 hypothetical protein [Baekduia sp.]